VMLIGVGVSLLILPISFATRRYNARRSVAAELATPTMARP
jgi:hypothetical protein